MARIAVSGAHLTGKSSLVEALGARLPNHTIVPELNRIREERGYAVAYPPTVGDFVAQMRQSLVVLRRRSPNMIFDRCPLDFLGYVSASPGAERFDLDAWRAPIERAMATLDLVVSVHVDHAAGPALPIEDAAFRLAVDDLLRDIVDGDAFDLCENPVILALDGPWRRRVETVLAYVAGLTGQGGR